MTERVSIANLPECERPRERLRSVGRAALSDSELVALVIGGDLPSASALVSTVGGAPGLARAVLGELEAMRGIGQARACQLLAAVELGGRAMRFSGEEPARGLRTPAQAAAYLGDLAHGEEEELHVIGLDTRHRPLLRFLAAKGTLNIVHVSPREIFRRLVREGAAATIVAHNHPSGDPTPSRDDVSLTRRLARAGELIGVPMIDHIVIARGGFHALSDEIRRALGR